MGSEQLRGRTTWQDYSGQNAGVAERNFYDVLTKAFEGTDFRIRSKPREFSNIYGNVELSAEIQSAIYSPNETWRHGVIPDYGIDNVKTGKTLYVEVKRQDGWVEGKPRSAGRGNAHERSCKFFTPGLLRVLRDKGNLGQEVLPFWVVYQGDIARDPKRVREIHTWFGDGPESAHFFLWSDSTNPQAVIDHFANRLAFLLD
jgi:hypothetical protein